MSRRKKAAPEETCSPAPARPSSPKTREEQVYDAAWSAIRVVKTLHLWREGKGTGPTCTCLICQKARALRDALCAAGIDEPVVPKITPTRVEEAAVLRTQVELTEEVLAQLREKD